MSLVSAISIDKLRKVFPRGFRKSPVVAVDDLSLEIKEGEIFGFLGPNGAGKTTTIKMLMGFTLPTSGMCTIFNKKVGNLKVKQNIGFLSENPYFYDFLTGWQTLKFYGSLFSLKSSQLTTKINELSEMLNLERELFLPLKKQSKGMIQRIGLAQALINDPKLLILDEPMSGLDPVGRKEFRDIINKLKERGKTIFFSSHILSDIEILCDRVCIIARGKILEVLDIKTFKEKSVSLEDYFIDKIKQSE